MKYNEKNKPLVCMMTQSTCYKETRRFTPKGVLWHSTGANNPNLKRYVQPDDNAPDRAEWLAKLGKNAYANDWNHINREAGLNFWIGKLADGTVAAVQTMPWDYRPWGCGSGSKGSCNDTHIQFEICEDALTDAAYFNACYQEACEMTAYLCKMFGIDPKGTISYNGLQVPTIIDHTGSHALGLGSNHGDIQHWSRRYGKTMENVRNDVAAILAADDAAPTTPSVPAVTEDNAKAIWDRLYAAIQNPYAAFDDNGNQVYPAVKQTFEPYLVKVSIDDLNYRKGPSTSYASWGYIPVGVYTIVDEQDGWWLLKAYADKRNGWISLAYAKKL